MSSISSWMDSPPNGFSTTLSAGINSTALTIPLNSITGLGTEGVGVIFKKDADGTVTDTTVEFVHWTSTGTGTVILSDTGDRGIDGSYGGAAQAHDSGDYFEVWVSSQYYASQRTGFVAEHSAAGVHDSTIVKTTGAQTLEDKTLTSPTLAQVATPDAPAAGLTTIYSKSDGKLYIRPTGGAETEVGTGGTLCETFIIPGTLATGTDLAKTWVLPYDVKILSATPYVKTAGTTNATTFDVNLNGSTIDTTKLSIASGATSGDNQALDDPTTTRSAGGLVTIDCDSVSTTAPIEAYINVFYTRA